MAIQPIIFYDIPSKAPGVAWSPNTWKIRYALNFKELPYKTEWVEYPDIKELYTRLDIGPCQILKSGKPYYCLPVIHDPNTGATISDSARIADYLDSTYPGTPTLVPAGTHTLQKTFCIAYDSATESLTQYIIPAIATILRPTSEEYFVRTREVSFGKKLPDMVPTGDAHTVAWMAVQNGFGKIDKWMTESGGVPGPFVMGKVLSFADFVIAGELQWCKKGFGEDSDLWKDMMAWHGGRWAKLLDNLKGFEGSSEEMHD